MHDSKPVIAALDLPQLAAKDMSYSLDPTRCRVKIGKTLFTQEGPSIVKWFTDRNFDVMLDLKFNDIPHQVQGAVAEACKLGVWGLTIHTLGGPEMIKDARGTIHTMQSKGYSKPHLLGVTILTSIAPEMITEMLGYRCDQYELKRIVSRLGNMGVKHGCDGIVCSPHEVGTFGTRTFENVLKITPGIRIASVEDDDQVRAGSPQQAFRDGATHLVIGRNITGEVDPMSVVKYVTGIRDEIQTQTK